MEFLIPAILLGAFGSFHCIMMCGPLVHALPLGRFPKSQQPALRLYFIAGRWLVYGIMGGMVAGLQQSVSWMGFQQALVWTVLTLLLLIVAFWEKDHFFHFRQHLIRISKQLIDDQPNTGFFVLGMANGIIPCGTVYAALSIALMTPNAPAGFLAMVAFGISNSWWHLALVFGLQLPRIPLGPFSFLRSARTSLALVVIVLAMQLAMPFHNHFGNHSGSIPEEKGPICRQPSKPAVTEWK